MSNNNIKVNQDKTITVDKSAFENMLKTMTMVEEALDKLNSFRESNSQDEKLKQLGEIFERLKESDSTSEIQPMGGLGDIFPSKKKFCCKVYDGDNEIWRHTYEVYYKAQAMAACVLETTARGGNHSYLTGGRCD